MDANNEKVLGKFYKPEIVKYTFIYSSQAMTLTSNEEFTLDLISNASIKNFRENTVVSFRNQVSQPIQLEGQWKVALRSISFPSRIKNVDSAEIIVYIDSGSQLDASHHRSGPIRKIRKGIYKSWQDLFQEIRRVALLTQFYYKFDFITGKLILTFGKNERISFQVEEIPSILGFQAKPDPTNDGFHHIGYKLDNYHNRHTGNFPVDITCGSQFFSTLMSLNISMLVTHVPQSSRSLSQKDV